MKHPFNLLKKADIERLRRRPAYGSCIYSFTDAQLKSAHAHLQTLYPNCNVQLAFTSRILLLNELY